MPDLEIFPDFTREERELVRRVFLFSLWFTRRRDSSLALRGYLKWSE